MEEYIEETVAQIEKDTDYFHKARLIEFLRKKKDVPLTKLSQYLHMKPAYICHIQRLNKLPDIIVDGYYSELVSLSHLFVIARLKTHDQMLQVYEKVLGDNFTVLQTEEMVRNLLYQVETTGDRLNQEELEHIKKSLEGTHPHTKLKVIQTRIKSTIVIEVKGSLKDTSPVIRESLQKLTR